MIYSTDQCALEKQDNSLKHLVEVELEDYMTKNQNSPVNLPKIKYKTLMGNSQVRHSLLFS